MYVLPSPKWLRLLRSAPRSLYSKRPLYSLSKCRSHLPDLSLPCLHGSSVPCPTVSSKNSGCRHTKYSRFPYRSLLFLSRLHSMYVPPPPKWLHPLKAFRRSLCNKRLPYSRIPHTLPLFHSSFPDWRVSYKKPSHIQLPLIRHINFHLGNKPPDRTALPLNGTSVYQGFSSDSPPEDPDRINAHTAPRLM